MPPRIAVEIEIFGDVLSIYFNDKTGKWVRLKLDSVQAQLVNARIVEISKERNDEPKES